jgi:hypothetical protein
MYLSKCSLYTVIGAITKPENILDLNILDACLARIRFMKCAMGRLGTKSTKLLEYFQNVKVNVTCEEQRFQGTDVAIDQLMVLKR